MGKEKPEKKRKKSDSEDLQLKGKVSHKIAKYDPIATRSKKLLLTPVTETVVTGKQSKMQKQTSSPRKLNKSNKTGISPKKITGKIIMLQSQ